MIGKGKEVRRTGTKNSGITAMVASYERGVKVTLYNEDGVDMVRIEFVPWLDKGNYKLVYLGRLDSSIS